jgi:SAM-dependent MidA family methyltransferase
MMSGMDGDLAARLRRRIEASGPITFADFMDAALYDPDGGFFEGGGRGRAGSPVGADGDFVTSPHVSPLFGTLLSRLVEDIRALLGDPPILTVIEVGAGDGTLARALATGLAHPERTELVLVERSAAHRARLAASIADFPCRARLAESTAELDPGSAVGLLLANELLDNLPFHLVRRGPAGPLEVYVGIEGTDLILIDGPPSSPQVATAGEDLPPGAQAVVPSGAGAFLGAAEEALDRGYLVLVDYAAEEEDAEVHGYRDHGVVSDVLERPGSTDVTAGVDFELVGALAESLGLRSWGTVAQRDLLLALGYGAELDRLRDRQADLLNAGRGAEATRLFSERSRATLLVDRAGLGAFRALCLGKDVDQPPGPWVTTQEDDQG